MGDQSFGNTSIKLALASVTVKPKCAPSMNSPKLFNNSGMFYQKSHILIFTSTPNDTTIITHV